MSTQFETGFDDGDIIEANHVKQFAEPINELESGAALFRVATNSSGAYEVDFRTSANSNGHSINSLTQGQVIVFKASHDSPASATLKVLRNDSPGSEIHPLYLGDAQAGADDILEDQMVMVVFNNTTTPRFDVIGISSAATGGGGLTSPVAVADGGTGATTAAGARANLDVPSNSDLSTGLAGKANSSHTHAASDITSGTLSVTRGGTGGGTASAARTSLGAQAQDNALDEISALSMAKGDIFVHDGTAVAKLGPGSNGQVLTSDSAESTGLKWATASGGGGGVSDLDDLSDVVISSPVSGQVLRHNGTVFVNDELAIADVADLQDELDDKSDVGHTHAASDITSGTLGLARGGTGANLSATGGAGQVLKQTSSGANVSVAALSTSDLPTGISAANIGSGSVSNAEFGYLDGVTSAIQTQLDGKLSGTVPISSGGTGATSAGAARTNLGAQAQSSALDAIAGLSMAKGDILVHNGTQLTKMSPGTNGQLLSADSAQSTGLGWVTGSGGGSPTGTSNKVAYFNSSGALASTTNLSFVASNTQMGVGPDAPISTLHVSSSATGSANGTTGIVVSRGSEYLNFEAGPSGDSHVGTSTPSAFSLRTNNYARFTLNSNGKCTLFPEIVGGQQLRITDYASGAVTGYKGIELDIPGYNTLRMEVGTSNDSYVGTTASEAFSLRTNNTARFTINGSGKCTRFPEIVGGQQLRITDYATGAVTGYKGIELDIPGYNTLRMEVGTSNDSYVGTTASEAFSLRTSNTARFTINGSGKCTLFPELSEQRIKLGFASSVVNGSKGIEIDNGSHYVRMEAGNADDSYVGTATMSDFHLRRNDVSLMALRNGRVELLNNIGLRFNEAASNGSNYVELKSPASLSGNVSLTLPAADGTANQYLKTDGSGNLSWGTGPAGSGATNALAIWSSSGTVSYASGFSRSGSELVAPTLTTSLGQVFSNESYITLYGNSGGAIRADFQSSKTYIPAVRNYAAGQLMYWNSDGELLYQYSRGAHKEEIQPIELSMDDLMKWRPVEFKWKENFGGNQDIGFIAEEVAAVCPRAATYDQPWDYTNEKTGEYAVDESGMPKRLKGEQVAAGVKYEKAWIPMLAAVQSFYRRYQDDSVKHQDDLAKLEAKLEKRLAALEGARN